MPRPKWFGFVAPALLAVVFLLAAAAPALAQSSVDEAMAAILGPIGAGLSSVVFYEFEIFGVAIPWIVVWMGLPMLILTGYFGFINLRGFKIAWKVVRGRYWDETAPGMTNPNPLGPGARMSSPLGICKPAPLGLINRPTSLQSAAWVTHREKRCAKAQGVRISHAGAAGCCASSRCGLTGPRPVECG